MSPSATASATIASSASSSAASTAAISSTTATAGSAVAAASAACDRRVLRRGLRGGRLLLLFRQGFLLLVWIPPGNENDGRALLEPSSGSRFAVRARCVRSVPPVASVGWALRLSPRWGRESLAQGSVAATILRVPELPDLAILADAFDAILAGRPVTAVRVADPLVLRATPEQAAELVGEVVERVERRGKHLVFRLGGHDVWAAPMLSGGSGWRRRGPRSRRRS